MTRRRWIYGFFALMVLAQVGVVAAMIITHEQTLKTGVPFRFRIALYDPADPFRGRYVAVRVESNTVPLPDGMSFGRNDKVWVVIRQGDNGFAQLNHITRERPKTESYITARVRRVNKNTVHLNLPFDRYYMNEKDAPAIEAFFRDQRARISAEAQKHLGKDKDWQARDQFIRERFNQLLQNPYVMVRVRSGNAVLEAMYVGNKPIREFVREQISSASQPPYHR